MKHLMKQLCLWTLILAMVLSGPASAFAQVNHADLSKDKAEIINKKSVTPAKLEEGQTAEKLITNPAQPKIYTLRTDYKVQNGDVYRVNYQPYIASVGAAATPDEQKKVKKTIQLPDLAGYEKPDDDYKITYDKVKEAADGKGKTGNAINGERFQANEDFRYKAKANEITIKHVFQDLYDFSKYTNPDGSVGEEGQLITTQNGNTGSTMEVSPLEEKDPNRKGFVPEAPYITMQVPENAENFVLEYRYNRAHYDVNFDTKGGTPVPDRNLYYEQVIPKIDENSIPTKVGSDFLGWKPSIDLTTKDGREFKADETIKDRAGKPILNLDADLKMPASKITFTAVWKDKPKAEYVIQFWTEKPDYDDKDNTLPLRDRYDFIGARRIDNADTGSTPDLTNLDIHGITFPDLNDGRLEKAQDNKDEFERYYFLNEELTKKQNASKEDPTVQKSVLSTGETVYNVYYDRRVYTLYFTAPNEAGWDPSSSYWPTLTRNGQVIGKEGSPYKVEARFSQSLDKIWPKDEEISGLPPASSEPGVDMGPIGWTINVNEPGELIFRDTPPYRLSAEDFIDSQDVLGTGDYQGHGHGDQIPIGENQTKARGKYEISLASSSWDQSVVHHIDIIKDDFEGNEQIDYDLSYWKSDTNATYAFILPNLQGFTLKKDTRDAEWVLEKPTTPKCRTINDVNRARNEMTPFRSDADKIEYIAKFPWGTKLFDGKNRYNFANYTRNKYKLKLNNDPKTVKNDSEYGEGNILDVPYEFPLNDLKLDTKHVPEKPDWVRDDWSFLGWALDPSGNNLIKDGNETKLHYDQILYAKWGEPDYKWKVIFDPNGGSLRTIDENKLTTEHKTVKEGDIGQEVEKTYPIKEKSDGNKQIFTVLQRQKLKDPGFKPIKKGYDFLGWEIIRYKKDDKGDYTNEVDTSYRDTYKVPELYSFGNDVVSPIYLKAIWVPNQRVDVAVEHYFLDKDYNLDTNISPNPDSDTLEGKRAGYLVATTGDRQDDKYTLVPYDELEAHKETSDAYSIYKEYNDRVGLNNSFFQTFRVEPAEISDPEDSEKMIPNPDVKNNVFKFFYRPYRQREYKVNYIDENFKGKENEKDGAIIGQELVTNGNRHYDARNYRPIPGWVLTSAPQQQLFFDLNEETNELLGINGTSKDEITFYYKDVRVIEVPGNQDPPEGYVRVTFKADKGGSFGKDENGKDITELHYDVIKGLKSDLLPVPKLLGEGETADQSKYYITPDDGKKFTKWDNSALLNDNTIIDENHTFTAYFEWSGLSAKGMVRTEAFKDPKGTWTNDFAPTIDQLKAQLVWREKDEVQPLPEGTTIEFFDEDGNKLAKDEDVFKLVNEKKAADKDEVVRTVNITVKATFPDKKDPQELTIPITVYKNVYEALNKEGDKPLFLKEAEGKKAEEGGLQDVTGDYVKVTIKASKDFDAKDDKIYYVNKNAWVEIPEVKTEGSSTFVNWTADQVKQNDDGKANGIFDFEKRHMFTEDTVIEPVGAADVVEQERGKDKPDVPSTYVKVIVKTTDKATDDTAFEKTFWVNPKADVTIGVTNPTGKTVAADPAKVGAVGYTMKFSKWETEDKARTWEDKIVGKFENETTIIAKYSVTPEVIKPQVPTTDTVHTPQGKIPTVDQIKEKITPPEGKTISKVTIVENPNVTEPGESKVKVIVEYTDGSHVGTNDKPVEVPVEVHKNIIPEAPGGQRPKDAMDNYVKVIFKAGTGGSLSGDLVYYVSPEVEVDMTASADKITKTPSVGYTANGGTWSPEIKAEKIENEKTYEFNFVKTKDIVEKTGDDVKKPEGYVTVKFIAGENGEVVGGNKTYYVNPEANIKLVDKDKATQGATNELIVPEAKASDNYGFTGWVEEIDYTNPIKGDREHVAHFAIGQFTLTYKAGEGATGDVPEPQTAAYGGTVQLAGQGKLTKENSNFIGWKLDGEDKIYQPGDSVTLEKARTATAQWALVKYKVDFDTKDGSDVLFQEVEHGGTLAPFEKPTKDGFVFMGWKEKGKDEFFNLDSEIKENKTLVAQWDKAVEKIGENDPVDENHFIKVTFKQGKHGQLDGGEVSYKVAKDYSFDQAKANGLVVPAIQPNEYYKTQDANFGWDKELKLAGQDITFIAQYELVANVIPVDPTKDDETLKKEKPEEMVLVVFKVPEDKAFMTGNTKFYVKKSEPVNIEAPVVHPLTLENEYNDYVFKGWSMNTEDENNKVSFVSDTEIIDSIQEKPDIQINRPKPNSSNIIISVLTEGAAGYLEIIGDGIRSNTIIEASKRGRLNIFYINKEIGRGLKRDDVIKIYAVKNGVKSEEREYRVK
ncbi:InlB B-repeat-containing protein [Aedoeadaptatus coli]|uniref:InlB B-repeat-containing protein n=1 Tax=Aedoeadaptatus coli TaxID=2058292 RepID=UPI000D552366|nr:InlB B-repeat-containing protein [Peptoniphilus coli]